MQTKTKSILESLSNVVVGSIISMSLIKTVFPLFDIVVSFETNLWIVLIFTSVNLVRTYLIRRLFNAI